MDREDKPGQAEDFVERWSRRKLAARQDGEMAAAADSGAAAETAAPAPAQPEKELTDADMPPLESLDADSDYAPFLSPGVSDGLRQQAMRKLFAQPDFNITDGLNDYDEDYTQFTGLGQMVTHEMKRMLRRELERERTALTGADEPAGQAAGSADPDSDSALAAGAQDGEDAGTHCANAGRRDGTPG